MQTTRTPETPAQRTARQLMDEGARRMWETDDVPNGSIALWAGPQGTAILQTYDDGGVDAYLLHKGNSMADMMDALRANVTD